MTRGTMIYHDKRVPVVNVAEDHHLSESGVRDGWYADDASIPGSRMFYPADMFVFEPVSEPHDHGTEK